MLRVQAQLGFARVRDHSGPSRPWVMSLTQVGYREERGVLVWQDSGGCDCHTPELTASSFRACFNLLFVVPPTPVLLLVLPALGGRGQALHFEDALLRPA